MASTILGKRARAPDSLNEQSSIASCAKRRTQSRVVNDENADPNHAYDSQHTVCYNNSVGLDDLEDPFRISTKHARIEPNPLKPTAKVGSVPLSSASIVGHFKISKTVSRNEAKAIQNPTPQTPRHRDVLSKKVPITPRHRIGLVKRPLTPRTPWTPQTPNNAPTIYNYARQMFARSADAGRLVGREAERKELNSFIQKGIETRSGRCMYVSGPAGTGKSTLISEVCRDVQVTGGVKTSYINCMSVKSSMDVYGKLVEDLIGDIECAGKNDLTELRSIFIPKKGSSTNMYIVTLDEIDHLLTLDLEILYTLFEWSLHRSSRLVLLGIANALDLTERFLPRLKARNLKPQLLPFLPYTAPQIASIITTKLQSLSSADTLPEDGYTPFLHPAAIQFCSRKVAAQTGDLRKAFDIVCHTIDLVETEVKRKYLSDPISPLTTKSPLRENYNLSSPSAQPIGSLPFLTPISAPRATIAHVARVSASVLNHGTPQRLQILNLQQKAVLCTLISFNKVSRCSNRSRPILVTPSRTSSSSILSSTAPTVRILYETYCSLCRRENALHPLTATEFADVISGLETLGLIGEDGRGMAIGLRTPGKTGKGLSKGQEKRYVSWVGEGEVEGCLEGPGGGILRDLLRVE